MHEMYLSLNRLNQIYKSYTHICYVDQQSSQYVANSMCIHHEQIDRQL